MPFLIGENATKNWLSRLVYKQQLLFGFTCSLKTLIVADMRLLLVLYLGRCGAFDMPFLQEWKSFTRPQARTGLEILMP
jgi:hypothetical protein